MNRLISFYGDDFTGSTDVMEALASHGVETVLFTKVPTETEFKPFNNYGAFGLAGVSRSQSPHWMDDNLPQAFQWLKSLNTSHCHYKVCSTFDSSPTVGNIARATEIGLRVFNQSKTQLIVGAPQLKRYTFNGHLFAGYQAAIYRIDHHPVMSKHPVTPMHESSLAAHLAKQSNQQNMFQMIDVHDEASQKLAGQTVLQEPMTFVVGSSGVEYALMKALDRQSIAFPPFQSVNRLMVVSGSVSPTTERQIRYAIALGFEGISIDPTKLLDENAEKNIANITAIAATKLNLGKSVIAYTALGSSTDVGAKLSAADRTKLGAALGKILRGAIEQSSIRRVIIAGGDTSSHALTQLDITALTTRFPLKATPGSPLCTAHSSNPRHDALEIAMKGGQVGGDNYFVSLC